MTENLVLAPARMTTADIFNSAVASSAISAAWELGALDELAANEKLDVTEFATRNDLNQQATEALFHALASVRIVERSGGAVLRDVNFADVYKAKGFFHWLSRGCAELFANTSSVLPNGNRVGEYYRRDSAAIAVACRDINKNFFDPVFSAVMAPLEFTKVADLGCGSAERLIKVLGWHPTATGLGIDIAGGALRLAQESVDAAGLTYRVSLIQDDATAPRPRLEFTDVDLLTCFLMGHDMWPRDECIASLRKLRVAFPNVKRLLLGDTARTTSLPDTDIPVFTLGFEVAHRMMGVYLPTLEEWSGVFAEGGWRLIRQHLVPLPADSVIFELEPADSAA